MSALETILAFIMVFSLLVGLPVVALINKKNSPIGRALGDAIGRKGKQRRAVHTPEIESGNPESTNDLKLLVEKQQELLSLQQKELSELNDKLDFLQRLIDTDQTNSGNDKKTNPEE